MQALRDYLLLQAIGCAAALLVLILLIILFVAALTMS
jgi:hypothetical protein